MTEYSKGYSVPVGQWEFASSFENAHTVMVSITYDTNTPDLNPSQNFAGTYRINTISINIPEIGLSATDSTRGSVYLINNLTSEPDELNLYFNGGLDRFASNVGLSAPYYCRLRIIGNNNSMLANDQLPSSPISWASGHLYFSFISSDDSVKMVELSFGPFPYEFVVTSNTLNPANPAPGSTFSGIVAVKNQGTQAGNAGFLDVWVNQPSSVNCGSAGDSRQSVGILAPGETKEITFSNLSAGAKGFKIFRAFIDSACSTTESNEENNQKIIEYPVSIGCLYAFNPRVWSFSSYEGTGQGSVKTLDSCEWSPTSDSSWLLPQGGGIGSGVVNYSVLPNLTGVERIGQIVVQDQAITVVQAKDEFTDVCTVPWAYPYIYAIYASGITSGYGDGKYGCGDSVTREQMAIFLIRALDQVPTDGYCGTTYPFSDVGFDRWSCKYIKKLAELGITSGLGDGRFGPTDSVTREQMAVFLVRALNQIPADGCCGTSSPFSDVTNDWWSCKYLKMLSELGISTGYGDGRFGPDDLVTREQMAVFLGRAFLDMQTPDLPQPEYCPPVGSVMIHYGATVIQTGSVALTLSASDPTGVVEMCVSNTVSCSSWEPYATAKVWELLPGEGPKRVYVWFRDSGGNANSSPYFASIYLSNPTDVSAPTGSVLINGGAISTQIPVVTLTLAASDPSGVSKMCVSNTSSCSSWEPYVAEKLWSLPSGNEVKPIYVWFMDGLGNINSTPYSDSIELAGDDGGGGGGST